MCACRLRWQAPRTICKRSPGKQNIVWCELYITRDFTPPAQWECVFVCMRPYLSWAKACLYCGLCLSAGETEVARVDFAGEHHEQSTRARLKKRKRNARANPGVGRDFIWIVSAVEMECVRVHACAQLLWSELNVMRETQKGGGGACLCA